MKKSPATLMCDRPADRFMTTFRTASFQDQHICFFPGHNLPEEQVADNQTALHRCPYTLHLVFSALFAKRTTPGQRCERCAKLGFAWALDVTDTTPRIKQSGRRSGGQVERDQTDLDL